MIPFLDLAAEARLLQPELDAAARRVLGSGKYILSDEVEAFEREWAAYCGAQHCIGVGNGFDALRLTLAAFDIGPGDEVIVPANTYIATWLAVTAVGATVVPVEPDDGTCNINPRAIRTAVTPRTRAIIPVHLYGQPAAMGEIMALAESKDLLVIEDAAQAHGATFNGKRTGALGHAGCFSFYPSKNLGAYGDGGAVTTDSSELAARLRRLRNYGSEVKFFNQDRGLNSRLDELQAAFLRIKLPHLDEWNRRRREIAQRYCQAFEGFELVKDHEMACPVWHVFTLRLENRTAFQLAMLQAGVQTHLHYPVPPHLQEAYRSQHFASKGAFSITERMAERTVSLPMGPHMTDEQVDRVIEAVLYYR